MIKYTRIFITFLLVAVAYGATAQSAQSTATTSSPYSKYGLGDINPTLLPQNIGMGGIAAAINRISGYNNINPLNPASYAFINYTTIDAGVYANLSNFSQTGQANASNANFRLSHIAFAIPVSKRSALSFGLLPYSEMGYNNVQTSTRNGSSGKTGPDTVTNFIYNGNGGLSKAYLGYGFGIGHLSLGFNVSYIFGDLQQFSSTEPNLYGTLDTRTDRDNAVGGFNYDYGAQYSFDFGESKTKHLVLGYAASANSKINTTSTYIVSQYNYSSAGVENPAVDTLINEQSAKSKIQLPQINHFGISFQNDGHFIIGADYTMGHWSSLSIAGANQGFQDSKTFNIGGQFTPDINSLHNYFARTDYRLGFIYDESYLNLNNTNIKTTAVTFGFGLPLSPNNGSFYKINFSAEVGQRGTLQNGLVKQNFVNLHLAFTLNDKWFQRFKFD
ncbi:MAG TPA: hypothetical protein VIM16_10015 [Mucilaginibacter sp.]|jgi:hypothetical protein